MKHWVKRFDGEKEFRDATLGREQSSAEHVETDSAEVTGSPEECSNTKHYGELIKLERSHLLKIATAIIRQNCSDYLTHKDDVVQEGICKVLQARCKQEVEYVDPIGLLQLAVRQAAKKHADTCGREEAFDSNDPKASRLVLKKSFNDPTEIYIGMLSLEEILAGLDSEDIELFDLRFEQGMTYEEIAELRDCCVMTVQRAVKRLEKALGLPDAVNPSTPDSDI
jgi:RNA polymerase sigma factor (sigma-70 family)